MTENQLKYLQYQESARHNAATEAISQQEADTSRLRADETARSNLANETETHRSNVARESETYRSNLADEIRKSHELAETARANRAKEAENERTDRANEGIKTWQNVINAGKVVADTATKVQKNRIDLIDALIPF